MRRCSDGFRKLAVHGRRGKVRGGKDVCRIHFSAPRLFPQGLSEIAEDIAVPPGLAQARARSNKAASSLLLSGTDRDFHHQGGQGGHNVGIGSAHN
eukprot:7484184-Karenia_brevis.AAC.1